MDFSQSLRRMNLDISLFACLAALVIITGENFVFAFQSGEIDCILILCVFVAVFVTEASLASRSSWPQGAKTGRRIPKSSHHLLKGTCERKLGGVPDAVQLPFSSSGQTP